MLSSRDCVVVVVVVVVLVLWLLLSSSSSYLLEEERWPRVHGRGHHSSFPRHVLLLLDISISLSLLIPCSSSVCLLVASCLSCVSCMLRACCFARSHSVVVRSRMLLLYPFSNQSWHPGILVLLSPLLLYSISHTWHRRYPLCRRALLTNTRSAQLALVLTKRTASLSLSFVCFW